MDGQIKAACVLDAAQVEDLGSCRGQFEHLLVGDDLELPRLGHDARIGTEDAVDVGVDLAHVGAEGSSECDRGRVRTAATEGGDVLGVLRDALEPGDDRDRSRGERLLDAPGGHVDDAGSTVRGVGDEAGLRPGVGASLLAQVVDGHGDEGHGDALARGEEHVELSAGRLGRDLLGEVEELVGGVAHRGDDDRDAVPGAVGGNDPRGDPADALSVCHAGAAVLLHDETHIGSWPAHRPPPMGRSPTAEGPV